MKLWKEKAGVISANPIWCAAHSYYLYTADTLLELLWIVLTEWKHDKHLAM